METAIALTCAVVILVCAYVAVCSLIGQYLAFNDTRDQREAEELHSDYQPIGDEK